MIPDDRFSEDPEEFRQQLDEVRSQADQTPEQAISHSNEIHEQAKAAIIRDAEQFNAIGPQRPHEVPLNVAGIQRVLYECGVGVGEGLDVQLVVRIGEPASETYIALDGDLAFDEDSQSLVLRVPNSIAETFRQQGRRRKVRDLRRVLEL